MFQFTYSIKKDRHFRNIYNKGTSIANKQLVMYSIKNGSEFNNIGISASKKIGKSVIRNLIKRRIKEVYKIQEPLLKQGYDIIIIVRAAAVELSFNDLNKSVNHLLKKQKLFK